MKSPGIDQKSCLTFDSALRNGFPMPGGLKLLLSLFLLVEILPIRLDALR